ncbi:MAG: hypothetical protein ACLQU1_40845 [Bryobacteraceae bacterium]
MIPIACLVLLAATTTVELADEVYRIPPHYWRYMELGLKQRPALVTARFEVDEGPPRVRLALMTQDDLERLRTGLPHRLLSVTPLGPSGRVLYDLPQAGDYVLVVENRGAGEAVVHLRVLLDFSGRHSLTVTQITPRRRAVVVGISLAVFFAIVIYSARRLLRAIGR